MPVDPAVRRLIAQFRRAPAWDSELDLHLLRKFWPGIVGELLGRQTEVTAIIGTTLVVRVPDRDWRRQLTRMKPQILRRANEPWPVAWITDISFTNEDHGN